MSASDNLYRIVSSFATPKELCLLAVLYNDRFTRTALAARDMKALQKFYQISLYSYEDRLKEKYGVIFRNRPGKFEVVQGNRVIYGVPDDDLGACGNAVVLALKERDNCPIPAHYPTAVGGKYRPDPDDVLANVDLEGLFRVSGQVRRGWPLAIPAVTTFEECMKTPREEQGDFYGYELVNAVAQIYTVLRGTGRECLYEDSARTSTVCTVAELVGARPKSAEDITIVPATHTGGSTDSDSEPEQVEAGRFSKAERKLIKMLFRPKGYEKHADDVGEFYVQKRKSLFALIGSKFIDFGELPIWAEIDTPGSPQRGLDMAGPAPKPSAQCSAYSKACGLIMDYKGVDMNRHKEVRAQLVQGGLSEEARAFYDRLSHAKKMSMLRPISGRLTFERAVEVVADKLGERPSEILAEVVASKLILAKGAVKFSAENGVVILEK